MKTLTSLALHLLLGLLIGPLVFGQEPDEMLSLNQSEAANLTATPTPTTTTMGASRVPLMQIPEVRGLLQSVFQILSDELGQVSIPDDLTTQGQVLQAVLRQVNGNRILKRLIAQDDIRNTVPKPENVSQRCYDDMVDFVDGLIGQRVDAEATDYFTTAWALIMMDAFGKPASGYLPGTLHWVGNYDECYSVHATIPAGTYLGSRPTARENSSDFYARYCRLQMEIPSILAGTKNSSDVHGYWAAMAYLPSLLHWGMCLPESCREREVETLVTQAVQFMSMPMTVRNAVCFERDRDLGSDAGAVFAICFLSVVGAVVVVCTLLESAIFYGYLPLSPASPADSNPEEMPASSGDSSTSSSHGPAGGKAGYYDVQGNNRLGQEGSTPRSANPRTPLARDGHPKDVLGDETPSASLTTPPEPDRKTRISTIGLKLLQALSLRYNGSKLLATSTESNPGVLESVQGLRVLAILWIILGHTYTIGGTMDVRHIMFNTLQSISQTAGRLTFTFVAAADMGVETFFTIGGLLVMTLTLRELRKSKKGMCFWLMLGPNRMKRLLPVYMMVLMTGTTLYDHIVDGPLKAKPYMMFEHCESHWWTNLLFMNNVVKPLEMCMPWTWFLAVDFQLYTFTPMFIMLYNKKSKAGLVAMLVVVLVAMVGTFFSAFNNPGQMLTMFNEDGDFFKNVYIKPHTRMSSYFIGMLTAVVMEDFADKIRLSKLKQFLIWTVLSAIVLFLIMIPHDQWKDEGDLWPKGTQAVYETFKRPLWSLFIAWIIFSCQTGRGGKLATFLKWKGFQPLARLTYAVYLVHPMVITFFLYERNLPVDLEDGVMIYRFLGNVVMSYLFAALFALLFECPLVALDKMWARKK